MNTLASPTAATTPTRSSWPRRAARAVQRANALCARIPESLVAALARFYKIQPEEILVAHDELDVVPGQAKLKFGGSHAGHNGLRDIHAQLGTGDYWRLRIGIGHPGVKSEVINWVLKKPAPDQRAAIEECIARTLKAVPAMLAGEMDKATLVVHTHKPPRPKPPRPDPT